MRKVAITKTRPGPSGPLLNSWTCGMCGESSSKLKTLIEITRIMPFAGIVGKNLQNLEKR